MREQTSTPQSPNQTSGAARPIKIMIADAHALFRAALRKVLESDAQFKVIGEAANGVEAIQLTRRCSPDVLLTEIDLPECSGLQALRALQSGDPVTRPLLLVNEIQRDQMIEALRLGAYGFLQKTAAPLFLFQAVRAVVSGQYWLGPEAVSDLVRALREDPLREEFPIHRFRLTRRELQIVKAVAGGCTNKDVARQVGLSEVTIKHHLTSIYQKLGVSDRLKLALFACEHNLIENYDTVVSGSA